MEAEAARKPGQFSVNTSLPQGFQSRTRPNAIPDASTQKLLANAASHLREDKLASAHEICQEILRINPDHASALNILGMIAQRKGMHDVAVDLLRAAVTTQQNDPIILKNLGNALLASKQVLEAVKVYELLVRIEPSDAEAHNTLGDALLKLKRFADAFDQFKQAAALSASYAEAYNNAGYALESAGNLSDAIVWYRRAIELRPGYLKAHINYGNTLAKLGNLEAAKAQYRAAIAADATFSEAHNNLANVLQMQGQFIESIAHYRQALAYQPKDPEIHSNLGTVYQAINRPDEAFRHYSAAIDIQPSLLDPHICLGALHSEYGDLTKAEEAYHHVLALSPEHPDALVGLAGIMIDLGRFNYATEFLNRAFKRSADHPWAWSLIPQVRKMTSQDGAWLRKAQQLLARTQPALTEKERTRLLFAMGKYCDDTGAYDLAFAAYTKGNLLRRKFEGGFDRAKFTDLVDTLIATYDAGFFSRHPSPNTSSRPAFILGMPRSGTSLLEQILASHHQIFGAGELRFWTQVAASNRDALLGKAWDTPMISQIAHEYDQLLAKQAPDAAVVIDKMPTNFLWVGFIHAVLPQARILHTQRNPLDTCLSNYFQNYGLTHSFSFSTDLEDLVCYYSQYKRLMDHWRTVLPAGVFLDVPYEDIVDDQDGWSRKIIDFLELEWDERCLEFYKTERKVGTLSNWQVRQKIYKSSKQRWRNYEPYLGPLRALMTEHDQPGDIS